MSRLFRLLMIGAALALPLAVAARAQTDAMGGRLKTIVLPRTADAPGLSDYLAANDAAADHDLAEAGRLYRQALKAAPENADILARAFLFTAAGGDLDEAAALAKREIAISPDDRTARLVLAVSALRDGDDAAARTQLAQSKQGPFSSLTVTLLDAWAAYGLGDTDAAIKDLTHVTEQGGTEALARFHSALILDLAGKPEEAEKDFKAALLSSGPTPREVDAYGRFLERAGRAADATAFYANFKERSSLTPIIEQADARLAAGIKPDRLIGDPKQGAAEALFGIAASLTDASTADAAILYLRLSLALAPDLDLAKIVLADRLESLEKYAQAVAVYDSVSAASPFKTAAAIQAAIDKTRIDQVASAITDLIQITQAHPDNVTGWTALGDAYRSDDKFAEAASAYDHAVRALGAAGQRDWPLFFARGVSEEQSKNWSAAEADLKRALALSPDQPQVLNYLGYSWVDRGLNLPQALALLEKARSLAPADGYIVDSVGWAYYRLGRYKDAVSALAQAVQLVPADPTINAHYGDALWRVGRKLEAHFQWDHALIFGATDGEKDELVKKLANGLPPASPLTTR